MDTQDDLKINDSSKLGTRMIIAGLGFLVGLVLGYVLGAFRIHEIISLPKITIDLSWINLLGTMTPNPSFLSDVAAFEAAIIAFLVPLSIEIISKLSERYNSDVITRSFMKGWENRILPLFLLINIVTAIVLRFFIEDSNDSLLWKISAWIVLLMFIYIAFAIWRVINRIKLFMSDTKSVVNQLYEDIEESIQ